jgi:type I restriction enzyme, S subunit
VIASDWPMKQVGSLFEIGAGKSMSAAAREGNHKVPFLRTSNVFWDRLDLGSLDEMSIPPDELSAKLLSPGDLLVCEGGDIGRAAIWDGSVEPMSFQNHLHRLRPLIDDVEPRFYVFFLQFAFTQLGLFDGAGNNTTIPNLSSTRLASLEVPHPPPEVQNAIVRTLGTIRQAIDVQTAALETAETLRASVMASSFSRGLHGEPTAMTEIGELPKSWELIEFATVRESMRYGTSVRCTPAGGDYPVLRIPNVYSARIDEGELKYCNLAAKDADRFLLEDGDLLFIRTNGVIERLGLCAVYRGQPENALFASYLIRARLKPGISPDFVAYYFGSPMGIDLIAARATPAADGKYNLNTGIIDSLQVPIPSLDEQEEIAAAIHAVDRKIEVHRAKLSRLHELFEGLLCDLMTGAVRSDDLVLPDEGSA